MKYGNKKLNKVADGIYQVQGKQEFYFMFKLNNKKYMINASKEYNVKTKTKAKMVLDEVKTTLRQKGHREIRIKTFDFYFNEHLKGYTSKNTLSTYKRHYKWIKPYIGHLKPNQIKPETIKEVLKKVYKDKGDTVKEKLKFILNPVFRKLLKEQIIENNPLDRVTFPNPKTELEPLPQRLQIPEKDMIKVAQNIFSFVLKIQDKRQSRTKKGKKNKKLFYLFSIMLVRRRSEILQYKFGDIKDGYLFVKKEYTKHKQSETILLPKEILELIPENPEGGQREGYPLDPEEHLVNIHYTWASSYFKQMVQDLGYKMRLHDLRQLFFIVMFQRGYSMDLLDVCLSHSIKGTRKHYLTSLEQKKEECFHEWWEILRGK